MPLFVKKEISTNEKNTVPAGSIWAKLMFGKKRIGIKGFTFLRTRTYSAGGQRRGDGSVKGYNGFTYLRTATYSAGGQTHTVKEYRHNVTWLEFVLVPGGTYYVNGDWSGGNVRLSPYLISKTEVTQSVWKKIMGTTPWSGEKYVTEGSDYPATYVSWNDAKSFCKKTGMRLPTEVEWEVACRAGTKTTYYWGDSMDGDYAWYNKNAWDIGEKYAHRVAQKKPNAFGFYDMSGNVWEWCSDWYDSNTYPSGTINPKGVSSGSYRVYRGGCFYENSVSCRSGYRWISSGGHGSHLGFRLVFSDF